MLATVKLTTVAGPSLAHYNTMFSIEQATRPKGRVHV